MEVTAYDLFEYKFENEEWLDADDLPRLQEKEDDFPETLYKISLLYRNLKTEMSRHLLGGLSAQIDEDIIVKREGASSDKDLKTLLDRTKELTQLAKDLEQQYF